MYQLGWNNEFDAATLTVGKVMQAKGKLLAFVNVR